jgi:hypothetical protein
VDFSKLFELLPQPPSFEIFGRKRSTPMAICAVFTVFLGFTAVSLSRAKTAEIDCETPCSATSILRFSPGFEERVAALQSKAVFIYLLRTF